MLLQLFPRVLATAAILTTAVQASPFHSLDTRGSFSLDARDLFVPSTCSPLVYGATAVVMGNVCVGISGDSLTIIYTVNPGWTIDVVHALITTSIPTAAQDIPGQFPYSSDKGTPPVCVISADKLTSTCTIPVQSAWRVCGKTLYIVTHAGVTGPDTIAQTAWGKGPCYDAKGNCAKYWTFTEQCVCKLEIDYFPVTSTVRERLKGKLSSKIILLTSSIVYLSYYDHRIFY
jgi:hypothetical protein